MSSSISDFLSGYWSAHEIAVNLVVVSNIFGALLLGMVVGYERTFHGRAAGMRTYGLVCMASCALTVIIGYPSFWYGGSGAALGHLPPDPTRVIQGIVTGVGFLGAGVIMRDGMSISGLTTAASIWSSSAIGILVGIGFYSAAILLTLLSVALMMWALRLERWLPAHPAIAVVLHFSPEATVSEDILTDAALARGYKVAGDSFQVLRANGREEWRFVAIAIDRAAAPISVLAAGLGRLDGVEAFQLAPAKN
jgi:putative Mg2+ transporter-C (MgtC) family protein